MIEFSCIYCGGLVQSDEESTGKVVKCPTCGHRVVARVREPGDALKDAPGDDAGTRKNEDWQNRSDQEVFDRLLLRTLTVEGRRQLAARRWRWMPIPRCDDLTLFALSGAFSLLWFLNAEPAADLRAAFELLNISDVRFVPFLTMIAAAISILNFLLERPKSDREEFMMLLFTTAVTVGTGAYAGYIATQRHLGWLMIFPAWNILSGAALLLLFHLGFVDTSRTGSVTARLIQAVLTASITAALLTACHYVLHLHWAITFSITIGYILSLHNTVRSAWFKAG